MNSDIVKWHITQVATGYTSDPTFVLFPLGCVSFFMLIVSSQPLLTGPLYTFYAVAIVCQVIGQLLYGFSALKEVSTLMAFLVLPRKPMNLRHFLCTLNLSLSYGRITHRSRSELVLCIVRLCSGYKGPRSAIFWSLLIDNSSSIKAFRKWPESWYENRQCHLQQTSPPPSSMPNPV